MRINELLLVAVPGEMSTKWASASNGCLAGRGTAEHTHVAIVGLANQYLGFHEEYALQYYEGLDLIWSSPVARHCRTAGLPGGADGGADYASCASVTMDLLTGSESTDFP